MDQKIETKNEKNTDGGETILDAVIVGAGWSGLGSARVLLEAEGGGTCVDFAILEGRPYIGGRSRTVPLATTSTRGDEDPLTESPSLSSSTDTAVVTVELGSQWVHGATPENPVYDIALAAGVGVRPADEKLDQCWSDKDGVWFDNHTSLDGGDGGGVDGDTSTNPPCRSRRVPDDLLQSTYHRDFVRGFRRYQCLRQYTAFFRGDRSLRTVADGYIIRQSQKRLHGDRRLVFEFGLETLIAKSYGADLEDLSLRWWDFDDELPGGDSLLVQGPGKGYSGVVEHFAKPVSEKIKLRSKVTSIDWRDNDTIVIRHDDQNGLSREIKARTVIITVPLGVLQSGSIAFVPELPAKKLQAIDALGMGLYNKVILRWGNDEDLPWPEDIEWIGRLAPLTEIGKWCDFHNQKSISGENILTAITIGREAERVERLSNDAIKTEVLSTLRSMFGNDTVPDPKEILVTRWKADELSRGSFSYNRVGSKPQHRDHLGESVDDRLFFAGEATHTEYFGTTHGALMSGQRAGKNVLRKLRKLRK